MTLAGAFSLMTTAASGQTAGCEPIEQRAGREFGCFITAREDLGALPRDSALYWHIHALPTEASAKSARAARSTVVASLGRIWLFTIGDSSWRTAVGEQIAVVGPLPLIEADSFTAVYMEGVFRPGMQSPVHRHPGVEAWYTLQGEQCLETPQGKIEQRAGGPGVMVPGGVPMILTGTGTGIRRSLVLILQETGQPRSVVAADWRPAGLCHP
jgi:quercetin dioxygenase-like cupin family protein